MSLDLALLLTWVLEIGLNDRGLLWPYPTTVSRVLFWPAAESLPSAGQDRALLLATAAALLKVEVAVICLAVLGQRLLRPLKEPLAAALVASYCPMFLLVFCQIRSLYDIGWQGWLNDPDTPALVALLGLADFFIIAGIAQLELRGMVRGALSVPFWLLWTAWAGYRVTSPSLATVPLVSFALYCLAVNTDAKGQPGNAAHRAS